MRPSWEGHSDAPCHGEDEEQEYDVREAIADIAFEILENCHPGWEISDGLADGVSGTVSLDFPSLKVRLDHQAHYVGRQDYEYAWEGAAIFPTPITTAYPARNALEGA